MTSAVGWLLLWASLEAVVGIPTAEPLGGSGRSVSRDFEGAGYPEVSLNIGDLGPVRGFVKGTYWGRQQVNCFLGIPYVKKPARYEPPREFFEPWTEERDARVRARACPQGKFYPEELMEEWERKAAVWDWAMMGRDDDGGDDGSEEEEEPDDLREDCLTLDIYTPADAEEGDNLPVLFFIHGGAFVRGSSISARPDFIMDHGIKFVIVSIQYRLGALGFLSAGGRDVAGIGNAGLHDQWWALQWTIKYISYFGGDPNHIVAGGVSAGGATSGLLYVSPATNGLLKGALLFSGCSVSPWAIDNEPRRSARGVAAYTPCAPQAAAAAEAEERENSGTGDRDATLDAEDALVACMQNGISVEELLNATWDWGKEEKSHGRVGMGTTIAVLDGREGLLPQMPADIMLSGEKFEAKPIVVGVTREEGLYLQVQIDGFYMQVNQLTEDKKLLSERIGELILTFAGVDDPLHILGVGMQKQYFREEQLGNYPEMEDGVIDMSGAAFFKGPARRMAQLNLQKGGKTWLYTFDYVSDNERRSAIENERRERSNHGSDQAFIFPSRDEDFRYSDKDEDMAMRFSRMVATFVTTLQPSPLNEITVEGAEWPPLTEDDDDIYLSIGQDGWQTKRGFVQEYHATNKASSAKGLSATTAAIAAAFAAVTSLLSRSGF